MGCVARRDLRRIPSSGGYALEAVLVELNAGATTGFAYEVYIVPTGADTSGADPVVQIPMGGDESIQLEWTRPNALVIGCCDEAVVRQFRNQWAGRDANGGNRVVQVQLRSPSGLTPPLPRRAFY